MRHSINPERISYFLLRFVVIIYFFVEEFLILEKGFHSGKFGRGQQVRQI